jgi:hypothetical protein
MIQKNKEKKNEQVMFANEVLTILITSPVRKQAIMILLDY